MADGRLTVISRAIVLLDDEQIWAAGARAVLSDTEFSVVEVVDNWAEALHAARRADPCIVLVNPHLAESHLAQVIMHLTGGVAATHAVVTSHSDSAVLKAEALAGGASAFVPRTIDTAGLLSVLRRVAVGEELLTKRDLARRRRPAGCKLQITRGLRKPLTGRETEILHLLATGLPNSDIAAIRFVAKSTIKTHVENIIGKLGVSNRVEAVSWALEQGLIRPEWDGPASTIPRGTVVRNPPDGGCQ